MALSSATAHADTKIAYLDMQQAISKTEEGMRAIANLKKLFESRQKELDKKQKDMLEQRKELEKQAKVLSKDALQKRAEEWERKMRELQEVFVGYNKELEQKQQEAEKPIRERMQKVIEGIAQADGIDVVLATGAVVYGPSKFDITDKAIAAYNAKK